MKNLMSSWVGQLFWQGASAHFRHLKEHKKFETFLEKKCLQSKLVISKVQELEVYFELKGGRRKNI